MAAFLVALVANLPLISTSSPFLQLEGKGCEINGNCLLSHRRRRYSQREGCRVLVTPDIGPLEVVSFGTYDYLDALAVNNVDYSGNKGPVNVVPRGTITWNPTHSGRGWKICSTTRLQTTTPSPFRLVTGTGCEVQGKCLTSTRRRRYGYCPENAIGVPCLPEHCVAVIAPSAGPLNVTEFHTESGSDLLGVRGTFYSGRTGPQGVYPQGFVTWTHDRFYDEEGWTICTEPHELPPEKQPPPLPFTLLSGTACTVQGNCVSSARRRRYACCDPPEECVVQVNPGTGPLSTVEFGIGRGESTLTLNNVVYSNSEKPPRQGLRPRGVITWSTSTGFDGEGWTLCAPRIATNEPGGDNVSTDEATTNNTSAMVTHVLNGAGGAFDFPSFADNRTIARLACESHYGVDACLEGSCGCFRYYFRRGGLSCHRDKALWEFEWVFENRKDGCNCKYVGGDYLGSTSEGETDNSDCSSSDSTSVSSSDSYSSGCIIGFPSVEENCDGDEMMPHLFVRQRRPPASNLSDPWHTVLPGIGDKLSSHHLIRDLRATHFIPGSGTWPSLVGEAALVRGPAFNPESPAFMLAAHDGSDGIQVNLGTLTSATWSVWLKTMDYSKCAVVISSTNSENGSFVAGTLEIPHDAPLDEWFHLALSHHEGAVFVYHSGVLQAQDTNFPSYNTLLLGAAGENCSTSSIWLSDLAVFNRSLHPWEIVDLYKAGRPSGPRTDGMKCTYNGKYEALVATLETSAPLFQRELQWANVSAFVIKASVYLDCLSTNGEDAEVTLLQALRGTNAPCSSIVANMDCQAPVSHNSLVPLPLAWFCPKSCDVKGSDWRVISGDCTATERCTMSPFYPLMAEPGQACTVQKSSSSVLDVNWASGHKATQGWMTCSKHDGCGANCTTSATVSCYPGMQACGSSVLHGSSSCSHWQDRPHAMVESCEERAWLQLDLGRSLEIAQVLLQSCPGERHCGRRVELSEHGSEWRTVYSQGTGYGEEEPVKGTVMSFAAQTARYVRVSSSRTPSQALVRFLHVAVSADSCEDDESWTDSKYGDGQITCRSLVEHPDWCMHRGHYSVEAQVACPAACGTCGRSKFRRVEDNDPCIYVAEIDEAVNKDHTISNLACFWYCLSLEQCTHFQWEAGHSCKRLAHCGHGRRCRGAAALGTCRSSVHGGNYFAILPEKQAKELRSTFEERFVMDGFLSARSTGRCTKDLDPMTCLKAGRTMGLAVRRVGLFAHYDDTLTCIIETGTGVLKMQRLDPRWDECSLAETCLCDERRHDSTPLTSHAPVASHERAWIKQRSLDFSHSDPVSSFCNISNSSRCLGRIRTFRRLAMPGRLGPVVPFPVDWDADGDVDLLLGRISGELLYLQSVDGILDFDDAVGLPKATPHDPCAKYWQNNNEQSCGHWCCYEPGFGDVCYGDGTYTLAACQKATAWNVSVDGGSLIPVAVDLDGDSDLDLITASCDGTLQYWRRDDSGGSILTKMLGSDNPFAGVQPGGSTCIYPDVVDWDGDGDFDLLLGKSSGTIDFYENRSGHLTLVTGDKSPFHKVVVPGLAAPCAVDWDGDGDTDVLVGNLEGTIEFFARSDLGDLVYMGPLDNIKTSSSIIPRAVDWDADGFLDLLVADGRSGEWWLWISRSDGEVSEQILDNPFIDLPFGRASVPQVVDWNQDGHWDLVVTELDGHVRHYQADDDDVLMSVPINDSVFTELVPRLRRGAALQFVDWDSDGDLDMLVGQEGGELLFYGRDNRTGQFAVGQQLVSGLGNFPTPHAVDWDHDGDMDLFVGDSGDVLRKRSLKLWGFPVQEWNVEFVEQGPEFSIGQNEIFQSPDGIWLLAYCQLGYWFLFKNSSNQFEINRAGHCSGAVAKYHAASLFDLYRVGTPGEWEIHLSSLPHSVASYSSMVTKLVVSDGSSGKPFCSTCYGRANPECNCSLSKEMKVQCAEELCNKQSYSLFRPVSVTSDPPALCSCVDTDDGAEDQFGATCREYEFRWCGQYDSARFNAGSMCCLCGGGLRRDDVSASFNWTVTAECYNPEAWVTWKEAMSEPTSPEPAPTASVRYFETVRTSPSAIPSLEEVVGVSSPLYGAGLDKLLYRPFPVAVDWNHDGMLDLVVGSDSPHVRTFYSSRVGCRVAELSCTLSASECAVAVCKREGFPWGRLVHTRAIEPFSGGCKVEEQWLGGEVFDPELGKWLVVDRDRPTMRDYFLSRNVAVKVQCFAGGVISYFQGEFERLGEPFRLREQVGDQSPFSHIFNPRTAIAFVMDWDFDKQWDVVLGTDTGTVRYFKAGKQCEHGNMCNNRGRCDKRRGVCRCIDGYGLNDCSGCARHYFSQQTQSAEARYCLPCPGLLNGSICDGRGICMDDELAQRTLAGSKAEKIFTFGTGKCACNDPFHGMDDRGLISCTEGACGPGKEPRREGGDSATETCEMCLPGTSKNGTSNGECQVCPERYYAKVGAVECSACPPGRFQDTPEQDFCKLCPPGTASGASSIACTPCAVGRFASEEDMGECSVCPAGKWNSAVGESQCSDCDLGRFSSGREECQACDSGSFADVKGSSSCTECEQGKHSSIHEARTGTVCQLCSIGRYGSSAGAKHPDNCLSCVTGATTAGPGAANASMCIQPDRANHTCISGQLCPIITGGNMLQPGRHVMAITSRTSPPTLILDGLTAADGRSYGRSEPLLLSGGTYGLFWCAGIHGTCNSLADFGFEVGQLEITGPVAANFTCVRGRPCRNLGPVSGTGLMSTDALRVLDSCGQGPPIAMSKGGSTGLAIEVTVDAAGRMWLGFGLEGVLADPNIYQICWCGKKQGQLSACSSVNFQDFMVAAASLVIHGPWGGQEKACFLGQPCTLPGIQGSNMLAGDRLMVLGGEGQIIAGVPGGGIAVTADGSDFTFLPGEPKVLQSIPGLHRLYFCRPMPGARCDSLVDFQADAGFFTAKGPFSDQVFVCYIGLSTCELRDLQGHGLEDGDGLEVQYEAEAASCLADGKHQDKHPAGFGTLQVSAYGGGKHFSLGAIPANATPGQYQICWRPRGFTAFRASAGVLFVTCPAGTYRLKSREAVYCAECPLGFYCQGGTSAGSFQDDGKTPCKEGSTTQGWNSREKDQCLCSPGFHLDDSKECVQCAAGRYKPNVGDDRLCPEICSDGTTSRPGAYRPHHCFSSSSAEAGNKSQAEVFTVKGAFELPACLDSVELQEAIAQIRRTIANSLRISPAEVTLNLEAKACHSQNSTSRRLQSDLGSQRLTFRISKANKDEAESLTEQMKMDEIQAGIAGKVSFEVAVGSLPTVSSEVLTCSTLGAGFSFPIGSQVTSLDDCSCAPGYEMDTTRRKCQMCTVGRFKAGVGEDPCRLCSRVTVNSTWVRLTTLAEGATGAHLCTCPAGHIVKENATQEQSASCEQCKVGNYCPGGSASLSCPSGTSTEGPGSTSLEQCICEAGFTPSYIRNESYRCKLCDPGTFKPTIGDELCSEQCRANSNSYPGAKSGEDCFCNNGTYHLFNSLTSGPARESMCVACPEDGVECPGGFEPADSKKHAVPRSLRGYYLTGFADAEECFVFDEEGESLCLPGATAQNESAACGGSQTGIMCGACMHLSARDLGDEACEECEESFGDWMHVASLNLDLCLKAAFGIFLGKQAMDSATKSKKMEAVMLRILLQWATASSVLGTFDLSSVRIFDWSIDEIVKQAESGDAIAAIVEASGVSFSFQFPEWFRPVWRTITAVTGSIPSPLSPQISLECLMQRQQPQPPSVPPGWQLLVPAIWWLLYPVFVIVWVAIICVFIAKVVFPLTLWFTARVKKYLFRRMRGAGVSASTAEATVEALEPAQMSDIMKDHNAMRSDASFVKALGGDVFAEAAASFLLAKASAECTAMLQELVSAGVCAKEEILGVAREVLERRDDLLGPFLIDVIKRMDYELLDETFSKPLSIPPLLRSFLEEETTEVTFKLTRASSAISDASFKPTVDARGLVGDQADGDLFGDEAIPGKDLNEGYVVFGLFQGTSVSTVLIDAFPLYAVTLYSLWDVVTRRMLGLVQVKTILITLNTRSTEPRWLYDMRFTVFQGDHVMVGLVAVLGLLLWSVTFLVVLFRILRSGKYMLQEKGMMRNFGYFYSGLEPNAYWWEVVVKKSDIFVLYAVTFTEVFPDPKAKLVMYLALAGIFWAAHNMYHPYDDRQNHLADRIEDLGLGTRFITILVIQLLLMLNARPAVNAVMATLLIVINVRFLCIMGFILAIENTGTEDAKQSARDKITEKVVERFGFGGHKHPLLSVCMGLLNRIFKYTVRPIVGLVFKLFSLMAKLKERSSRKVPHLQWQGVGSDFIVITHEHEKLPWLERVFSFFVSRLYKLEDKEQKAFIAHTIAKFWDYVLNNSECHQLPPNIMDIFFLLPSAVKQERAEPPMEASAPFHIRVARRVRTTLVRSCPEGDFRAGTRLRSARRSTRVTSPTEERRSTRSASARPSARSSGEARISTRTPFSYSAGLPEHTHSGEDFNSALLFIQRLSKNEVHEFLVEALTEEDEAAHDAPPVAHDAPPAVHDAPRAASSFRPAVSI